MARFHRYSLHNVCLIVAQRPTETRVAGFHTWRTLGRFVRKGEKGIAILAPVPYKTKPTAEPHHGPDEPHRIVLIPGSCHFMILAHSRALLP